MTTLPFEPLTDDEEAMLPKGALEVAEMSARYLGEGKPETVLELLQGFEGAIIPSPEQLEQWGGLLNGAAARNARRGTFLIMFIRFVWERFLPAPVPAGPIESRKTRNPNVSLDRQDGTVRLHARLDSGWQAQWWDCCAEPGCFGEKVCGQRCISHCTEAERGAHVADKRTKGATLSFRGVDVSADLVTSIFGASGKITGDWSCSFDFSGANILGELHFRDATIAGNVTFFCATFETLLFLERCSISGELACLCAFFASGHFLAFDSSFGGSLNWSRSMTGDSIVDGFRFERCVFAGRVFGSNQTQLMNWRECEFKRGVWLDGARDVRIAKSTFRDDLDISSSRPWWLELTDCRFEGHVLARSISAQEIDLTGSHFARSLDLKDSRFTKVKAAETHFTELRILGPFKTQELCLRGIEFEAPVRIDIECTSADLNGARFGGGGEILMGGTLSLRNVAVGQRLRVSTHRTQPQQLTISSLYNADAGSMTFSNVNMGQCFFHAARNLRGIILESDVNFRLSPKWHMQRQCVADEFAWRSNQPSRHASRWTSSSELDSTGLLEPGTERADQPAQIAHIYRELRGSLESRSDQPGAADFYYGEMEMRRHDRTRGLAEQGVVVLYWMLSGYGLRASRAFAWLVAILLLSSVALAKLAFAGAASPYRSALLHAVRTLLPNTRTKVPELGSLWAQSIDAFLSISGPILIGLGLLAVRGRVKR